MLTLFLLILIVGVSVGFQLSGFLFCKDIRYRLRLHDSEVYDHRQADNELKKPIENSISRKTDPRSINKMIVDTFLKGKSKVDVERLRVYLKDNLKEMNQINVITLMHRCGKHKLDLFSFIDIESTVNLLDVKKSGVATAQGIANAVYSLQSMTSATSGSLHLINILSEQLMASTEIFEGQAISNSLYGLKGMSTDSCEVRGILSAVLRTIKRCLLNQSSGKIETREEKRENHDRENEIMHKSREVGHPSALRMTSQGIGSAFIGLQGMSSSNSDVKSILSILANSIGQLTMSNIGLDSQAVANILVGLKSSSSEHSEVREVLVALCKNLKRNIAIFRDMTPRELSMALQGLQGMSSEHPQVDELLTVLCDGLDYRTSLGKGQGSDNGGFEFKSGDEIGPALGGLKQMSAENLQVRRLLRHINSAMRAGMAKAQAPNVQGQGQISRPSPSSVNTAQRRGGKVNVGTVSASSGFLHMTEQNIANSLYGLQSMDCRTDEVRSILSAIANEIMIFEGRLSGRTIANSLYGTSHQTY
jgi:hypothetical protein